MRVDELLLKKGDDIVFGAPANQAINAQATAAIGKAVSSIHEIREAHLPQCFAKGLSETPSQVLVLVLAPSAAPGLVMQRLGPQLHKIIPKGVYLDVLPIGPSHELVEPVRRARCQIYQAANRPWWKLW